MSIFWWRYQWYPTRLVNFKFTLVYTQRPQKYYVLFVNCHMINHSDSYIVYKPSNTFHESPLQIVSIHIQYVRQISISSVQWWHLAPKPTDTFRLFAVVFVLTKYGCWCRFGCVGWVIHTVHKCGTSSLPTRKCTICISLYTWWYGMGAECSNIVLNARLCR